MVSPFADPDSAQSRARRAESAKRWAQREHDDAEEQKGKAHDRFSVFVEEFMAAYRSKYGPELLALPPTRDEMLQLLAVIEAGVRLVHENLKKHERSFASFTFADDAHVQELQRQVIALEKTSLAYHGVHQRAKVYARNSAVTADSSLWIAVRDTAPGEYPGSSTAWHLANKPKIIKHEGR